MKETREVNQFISGATVHILSTSVVKVIGLIFTIPLANLLGGTGMGYFYAAYEIYNMLAVMASAGLPVAVSRMISESLQKGSAAYTEKIHRISLSVFAVIGGIISLLMFFGAGIFARFLENPGAEASIRALSVTVFCAFVMSSYRGYFQGHSNMIPTSLSQIIEALSKLAVGFTLAYFILNATSDYTKSSAGAIAGVSAGAFLCTVFLIIYKLKYHNQTRDISEAKDQSIPIVKELFRIAIPVSLGASILSIVNFVDAKVIMRQLQTSAGFIYEDANWLWGVYGNAKKLFNLPSAFITSLTISIIPALTAAVTRRDEHEAEANISAGIKYTMMIACPAGIAFLFLAQPIMNIIYFRTSEEAASGTPILALLGIAVIFNSLVLITNAILQSYGKVNFPLISMTAGGIFKVGLNWFLVGQKNINILGAPIATCLCYILIFALNFMYIKKQASFRLSGGKNVALIIAASFIMGICSFGIYKAGLHFAGVRLSGMICIAAGFCIYAVLLFVFKIITRSEIDAVLSKFRRKNND